MGSYFVKFRQTKKGFVNLIVSQQPLGELEDVVIEELGEDTTTTTGFSDNADFGILGPLKANNEKIKWNSLAHRNMQTKIENTPDGYFKSISVDTDRPITGNLYWAKVEAPAPAKPKGRASTKKQS